MHEHQSYGLKLRKSMGVRSKTSKITTQTNVLVIKAKRKKIVSCKVNQKCFCAPRHVSPIEFPPIWSEFRHNNQLCDGAVRCADGTEFKVHRVILAAISPYFKALFTNSINRNQPETRIACMNTSANIFSKLLDYAYTGKCDVNHESLESLIRFADQYEVMGVMQHCCQYILEHLEPRNCLGLLRFGRQYFCKQLEKRGRYFIQHNFVEIYKKSKEYYFLSFPDLLEIMSDDELNIKSEEIAFDAIRKWVDFDRFARQKYAHPLLNTIRLGNLSNEFLEYILQWSPIYDNSECRTLIKNLLQLRQVPKTDIDLLSNPLLRPRVPHDILFAIGGWTAGSPTNFIETYDTRADRWLLSRDCDKVPRAYHGICQIDGLIYMIGGFDGNEHFSTVRSFDPIKHQWRDCACMYYPRCYVSVATHNNKIYALGGYNGRIRMSSVERYDPGTNQWELIQSMQSQRSDASAAAMDNKIYIVGGFNGVEVMNSAEVYDIATNQWSYIPSMTSARSGVSLVACEGTLYALGGFNGFTRLTSGERYSPGKDTNWEIMADMFYSRSNFATVVLDGYIFAIGGFNDRFVAGSTTINHVECYDINTNEWLEAAPMCLNRSALSACVISSLKNARDYSLHGRTMIKWESPIPSDNSLGTDISPGATNTLEA